jgi:UDP-N-acetylmuramate--alanine ligase
MHPTNSIHFSHVHCIGIGGIGMSALAIILKKRGYTVSGSDGNLNQKSIMRLQKIGCVVHHDAETIPLASTVTLVIYSAAVAQHHHELAQARKRNIPIMKRSELLAELFNVQTGVSIAGAHGKTTTSSLIAHIFMHAKLDPTFAIGGHLHNYHTNAHAGLGEFFIAETCENDHTIELVHPNITILTNVDREHLDIYKDLDEIKAAFTNYINNTKPGGTIVLCHDDANTLSLVQRLPQTNHHDILTYGFSEDADIFITDFELHADHSIALVYQKTEQTPKYLGTFSLTIPGKHNLLNALAALITAKKAGISFETFAQACASFQGIDRRFTFKGLYKDSEIFDDYGHHPAEI